MAPQYSMDRQEPVSYTHLDDTTTIVFESAMFNGPSVRTTAKKLGLRTEASGRYEKGLDPNGCRLCLDRALELVQLLDAGDVVNGVADVWVQKREERRIPLRPDAVNRLLGTQLSRQEMVDILLPLGFSMDGDDVLIPSSRWDMERDCDIAEEVARYVGYNKMPSTIMQGVASARPSQRQTFREAMLNTLVGYGPVSYTHLWPKRAWARPRQTSSCGIGCSAASAIGASRSLW